MLRARPRRRNFGDFAIHRRTDSLPWRTAGRLRCRAPGVCHLFKLAPRPDPGVVALTATSRECHNQAEDPDQREGQAIAQPSRQQVRRASSASRRFTVVTRAGSGVRFDASTLETNWRTRCRTCWHRLAAVACLCLSGNVDEDRSRMGSALTRLARCVRSFFKSRPSRSTTSEIGRHS